MRQLILFILVIAGLSSFSQDSQLKMTVSKETVAVGERFKLTISINGASSSIVPPQMEGFNVVSGPYERSSTQLSNQGFSTTKTISYVISANSVGAYTIGAAETRTSSGRIRSNTIDIEVVERSTAAEPSAQNEQRVTINMPNGFKLMSFASKKEVVVGEPVMISYVLYSNERNIELVDLKGPQPPGFMYTDYAVEIPEWVMGADRTYIKMHFLDQVLIPLESGSFAIEPMEAVVSKGGFFRRQFRTQSDPLRVKVNPLPLGNGPDFRGAVGDMSISTSLSSNRIKTNAPVHLKVRITGSGNMESIALPELPLPMELEAYPPEINDRFIAANGTIQGSRTFDYLIIPRSPGEHRIPPIGFEYYDTEKKQYVQQLTKALTLVAEGAESSARIERPGQPDIASTSLDEPTDPSDSNPGFFSAKTLPYVIGTPLLALLIFFGFRKLKNRSAEKAERKARQADRIAERILKEARSQKDAGNTPGFYSSLYQAMNRYAEQKLQIPTAEMNRARVSQELASRSVDESTLSSWSRILDQCEQAAYSRAGVADPETLYKEVSQLIKKLEGML